MSIVTYNCEVLKLPQNNGTHFKRKVCPLQIWSLPKTWIKMWMFDFRFTEGFKQAKTLMTNLPLDPRTDDWWMTLMLINSPHLSLYALARSPVRISPRISKHKHKKGLCCHIWCSWALCCRHKTVLSACLDVLSGKYFNLFNLLHHWNACHFL